MKTQPARDRKSENDEKIIAAAFRLMAKHGCPELSFSAVASAVGISRRPLIDRYDSLSDLKIDVWKNQAGPTFIAWMKNIIDAFDIEQLNTNPELFLEVFRTAIYPANELGVALELLIETQFDSKLRDAIQSDLSPYSEIWFKPPGAKAGRNGYIVMLLVGFLLAGRTIEFDARTEYLHIVNKIIERAKSNRQPIELPEIRADYLNEPLNFDLEDKTLVSILHATMEIVGEYGYAGATVDLIVKRANSSQGALFARIPTKLDLFIEATRQHSILAMKRNAEFREEIDKQYGPSVGTCIFVRESLKSDWSILRARNLEQYRLTWYNKTFHENSISITSRFKDYRRSFLNERNLAGNVNEDASSDYYAMAFGMGLVFFPLVYPDAFKLPYDVMLLGD